MERLRSFCTLADNARASSTTLSEDILMLLSENGEIELSYHILFILHQRLPSLRNRIVELKKEKSYHLLDRLLKFPDNCPSDLCNNYWRLLLTGKCKSKARVGTDQLFIGSGWYFNRQNFFLNFFVGSVLITTRPDMTCRSRARCRS